MSLTKLYGAYINVPSETSTNCIWILTITRAIINFNRSKPVIGVWDIFSAIRLLLSDVRDLTIYLVSLFLAKLPSSALLSIFILLIEFKEGGKIPFSLL